jgi:hypothetical protein
LFFFVFSVGDVELRSLQGIGPLALSLPLLPKGVAVQAERKRKRSDGETLGARMSCLRAKKKGKGIMRPVEREIGLHLFLINFGG